MNHARMNRRRFAAAGAATLATPMASARVHTHPSHPIRVVVPHPAEGSTDHLARAVQQPMAEWLSRSVVTDNRAGAGGAGMAAKSVEMGERIAAGIPHRGGVGIKA